MRTVCRRGWQLNHGGFPALVVIRPGQGKTADTDIWTGQVSVDEAGKVWLDSDDQPKLEIVPDSETEFFIPGFIHAFRFVADAGDTAADRMIMRGGSERVFERQ